MRCLHKTGRKGRRRLGDGDRGRRAACAEVECGGGGRPKFRTQHRHHTADLPDTGHRTFATRSQIVQRLSSTTIGWNAIADSSCTVSCLKVN